MVHLGRWSILGYGYCYHSIVWVVVWDSNKVIDIGEWSICGGGRLERFYCMFTHTHRHTNACAYTSPTIPANRISTHPQSHLPAPRYTLIHPHTTLSPLSHVNQTVLFVSVKWNGGKWIATHTHIHILYVCS